MAKYTVTIDPSGARTILRHFDDSRKAFKFLDSHVAADDFDGFGTLSVTYPNGETETILCTLETDDQVLMESIRRISAGWEG